jgi:WD repeat-containing protein 23
MQLLGHAGLGRIFASDLLPRSAHRQRRIDDDDETDEDDSDAGTGYDPVRPTRTSGRRRRPRGRAAFEKVPSEQGKELMQTGNFGSNPRTENTIKRKKRLAYNIMRRELGAGSDGRQKNASRLLKQNMIPESVADTIIHYNARCYSGQFSDDGNFFFSCAQDFRVRMYDTSNPYDWKYYKSVDYPYGQWTITDASLSPDNRFLAYSSIQSIVCLAPTDPENESEPNLLNFANTGTVNHRGFNSHFGVSASSCFRLNKANLGRSGRYDFQVMVEKSWRVQATIPSTFTTLSEDSLCFAYRVTKTTSMLSALVTPNHRTFSIRAPMTRHSRFGIAEAWEMAEKPVFS